MNYELNSFRKEGIKAMIKAGIHKFLFFAASFCWYVPILNYLSNGSTNNLWDCILLGLAFFSAGIITYFPWISNVASYESSTERMERRTMSRLIYIYLLPIIGYLVIAYLSFDSYQNGVLGTMYGYLGFAVVILINQFYNYFSLLFEDARISEQRRKKKQK